MLGFPHPHFAGATPIDLHFLPLLPSFSWQTLAGLPKCSESSASDFSDPHSDFTLISLNVNG